MNMTDEQPMACTLTTRDLRDRLGWIVRLNRDALRGHDRVDLTLRLRYAPGAIQGVRELMCQEQVCCSFLSFELHEQPDEVWLTIKAPEGARGMADALFEPFLSVGDPRP
jgi:hypothetical protein